MFLIFSLDRNYNLKDYNPAAADYFNFTSESIGKSIYTLLPSFIHETLFIETITSSETRLQLYNYEVNGDPKVLSININPTLTGFFLTADTGLPSKEGSQKDANYNSGEDRVRAIISSLAEGIVFYDKEGNIIDANDSAKQLLRYTEEYNVPAILNSLLHRDGSKLPQSERPVIAAIRDNKAVHNKEIGIPLPDGTIRWISVNAHPVYDRSGEISGAVASFFDITDRKTIEEVFKKEKELLQTILDSIPVMITIYDPQVKGIVVNKEFEKLTGWKQEEINRGSIMEMVYPDPAYRKEIADFMAMALPVFRDISMTVKDGSTVETIWANIKIPDGRQVGIGLDIRERKRAEEKLKESEERYRILAENLEVERGKLTAILENLPVGVGVEDSTGRTLFLNNAGLRMHGFNTEEEMYVHLEKYVNDFELYYPDNTLMPFNEWPVSRALKNEFVEDYEVKLRSKARATERLLSYSVVPVRNNEWEIVLLVYVIQDLTDRKEAERALKESEERFRTLADNIAPLAWMADEKGNVLWFNKRWYDYTGLTVDIIKREGWEKVYHPEYVKSVIEKYYAAINNGAKWEDIFPLLGKEGNYRWFLSRALPVRNDQGKIIRWFGTNTDITEQKQLQEDLTFALNSLKENEARLLDAQKLANLGSLEIYPDQGYILWSEIVFNIFGRDKKYGTPDLRESFRYIHPDDRQKFKDIIDKGIAEKRRVEVDFRVIMPRGRIKYLNIILSPLYNEKGNVVKLLGAIIDITERKLAQLKLEEAYSLIQDRLKEKEVLLKELYHRTKNNMQVISSLLGLKASSIPDKELVSVFEDMQSRIHAIALVHEKLYQSKNLSKVNLNEYTRDLVDLLIISHSTKNLNIKVNYDLDNIFVLIDTAVPCGLMLTELVLNSIEHAFTGRNEGSIYITLKRMQDQTIELTAADDGNGIKESDLNKEEKLGLQLFRNIAEGQLEAVISVNTDKGVKWTIKFQDSLYQERV